MSGTVSIPSIKKWARLGVCSMAICWAGHACAIETGSADKKNTGAQKTREYGELSMSLSLTLSPVGSLRKLPAPPVTPGDLPPEMPGDQTRSLGELGAEIEAVEKLIDARQRLLSSAPDDAVSVLTKSSVQESPMPISGGGASGVADTGSTAESEGSQFTIAVLADWAEGLGNDGLKALRNLDADGRSAALVLVLLAAAGLVGYLGWKSVRGAKPSRYKTTGEIEGGETGSGRVVNVAAASLGDAEQVTNVAGVPSRIEKTIHPPEYGMLEEADIYLRFGHDKLAEEALIEAFKLNPKNSHAYLTLLRIYFAREDRAAFDALAQQLHTLDDKSAWTRVTEMGRALDEDNPLYH
jgi:hypothetical protein